MSASSTLENFHNLANTEASDKEMRSVVKEASQYTAAMYAGLVCRVKARIIYLYLEWDD